MPKLIIDGIEMEVESGTSILQACTQAGIVIPHFCYHNKLSIAANCRMCLVEVENRPKPVPSCAVECADGMVVHTASPAVQKARKGVMELLLVNHPLDCPVCDKGGECDLQDLAFACGNANGRFKEKKRVTAKKEFGPLIKTALSRCIMCTRCVRFVDEVCGTPELGCLGRGEKLEIGTYVSRALTSEMQGNLVDICPTGALTSKPAAFTGRSWEYQKTETIDVSDAVGSNIRVDVRGNEVMRVLPRRNDDVNEAWISDKARFAIDGLKFKRLDKPYIRRDGKLVPASWSEAFALVAEKIRDTAPARVAALAGNLADCESMFALKALMDSLGAPNIDCRTDGADYDVSSRGGYIMNAGIAGIDDADAILLIGTNPRTEAAVINARIRKRWLCGGCRIGLIGPPTNLNYPYLYLGNTPQSILDLRSGKSEFGRILKAAEKPMFLLGAGALARSDGGALQRTIRELAEYFKAIREDWNGFNVLQSAASRVGGIDIGFLPKKEGFGTRAILKGKADVVWLLGADECELKNMGKAFVVYQGHHGDAGARRADVILPGAAFTEKTGLYVNTEGRPQLALQAAFPPGDAREDWKIIRAFSEEFGTPLPFDTIERLREKMIASAPHLATIGVCDIAAPEAFGATGNMTNMPFMPLIENFYMTDPIGRASPTMAKCTEEILPLLAKEVVK